MLCKARQGKAVIMGDYWENQVCTGPQERKFVECLQDDYLEQLAVESTKEKAILDLLFCNVSEN